MSDTIGKRKVVEALQAAAEYGAKFSGEHRRVAAYNYLLGYLGSLLDLSASNGTIPEVPKEAIEPKLV